MYQEIQINFPKRKKRIENEDSLIENGFNCEGQGIVSIEGVDFTIKPHIKATIDIKIEVPALSSEDIELLNSMVLDMLPYNEREKIKEHAKKSRSSDLYIWSFFGSGGGFEEIGDTNNDEFIEKSASYKNTRNAMISLGLSEEQIDKIIDEFYKMNAKTNKVSMHLECDNTAYDYPVSGSVHMYTLRGTIKTKKGIKQYTMLSNSGTAGGRDKNNFPPVKGKIIPLK